MAERKSRPRRKPGKRYPHRPGPDRIELDGERLREIAEGTEFPELVGLARIGCTLAEVAAMFGVTERTVLKRMQEDPRYRQAWERGIAEGKRSLRRAQLKAALAGNVTAQIWLGKQWLGQRDVVEHTGPEGGPIAVEVRDQLSAKLDELDARLRERSSVAS